IIGREHHAGDACADVGAFENCIDSVGAENAVPELEDDHVRLHLGELAQHRARERRAVRPRRGDDAEIGEDHRLARSGVLHREDVPPQRDAGRFESIDDETAVAHAAHDRAGGCRLACLHARARERDDRDAARLEASVRRKRSETDARRYADALPEIGEVQHDTEHAAVERLALLGIGRIADAEHASDVEHLDHVAGAERRGYVAGVAEERLAVPERADDDVALDDLRHASARELERVVGRLVREHFDDDDDALLGGDVRGDAYLVREATGLGDRGDLVDDYRSHVAAPSSRQAPARRWKTPGRAAIFENPSASAAVHSPAASPYTPFEALMRECGESTPSTKALPGRNSTRTSPVTRSCEERSNASMSRQTGSSSWPSCTRSP